MALADRYWISDDTERKLLSRFTWRKLNYRIRYDRALGQVLIAFERETSLCHGWPKCRVTGIGEKKNNGIMAVEVKHHKTRCLAERMKQRKR